MTTTKSRHSDQRSVTLWLQQQLADQVDQAIAAKLALVPGATMSRQTFITHAIQKALQGAGEVPPAPGPTAALPAPTVQPVAPAQHAQSAQTEVQLGSVLPCPESEPPLPELLVALRALFRARKRFAGTDGQGGLRYRDLTEVELARADRAAATFYENLMDFALAGAAGLNEAPFYPADGWTVEENGEEREGVYGERERKPLFSVFSELPEVFGYQAGYYAYRLPGPIAAAQAADAEAQAKAKAREDKAAAKAARAAQRAAKKTAPAAEPEPQRPRLGRPAPPALPERPAPLPPTPQQLLPEQPVPVASPFGAGPSES